MQLKCLFFDFGGDCVKQHNFTSTELIGIQISVSGEQVSNVGYGASIWLSIKNQPLTLIEDSGDSQYAKIVVLISKEEIITNPEMDGQESGVQWLYKDSCGTAFEPEIGDTSFVISISTSDLPYEGMIYQVIILKNREGDNPTKLLQNKVYQLPASGWIRADIDLRI